MLFNKKRTILFFVSLIGIVITSLLLVSTYAYQTVQTKYEDESKANLGGNTGIEVGNLEVNYTSNKKIELTNMALLPDYKTADYAEFTLDNTKSTDDVIYYIDLINSDNNINELVSEDFNYTLTLLKDNNEYVVSAGNFKDLSSTENFRLTSSGMPHFTIKKGEVQNLRLYLWLKDTSAAQNYEGKIFKRKIEITSYFIDEIKDNTLAFTILKNAVKNNNGTELSIIPKSPIGEFALSTEKIVGLTADDLGVSYYYRGKVNNNYLEYNGTCYRIIRIQGDGTLKLVLANDGTCSNVTETSGVLYETLTTTNDNGESIEEVTPIKAPYSCNAYKDNYFLGSNCSNRTQKKVIDEWYNNKYLNNETGLYDENLVSNKWCIENEIISTHSSGNTLLSGEGITAPKSYKCISKLGLIEDRTSLLNTSELIFSGEKRTNSNESSSYITNEIISNSIWLVDIAIINKSNGMTYPISYYYNNSSYIFSGAHNYSISYNVRPVVILKSGVELYSGNGTKTEPYRITTDPSIVVENDS